MAAQGATDVVPVARTSSMHNSESVATEAVAPFGEPSRHAPVTPSFDNNSNRICAEDRDFTMKVMKLVSTFASTSRQAHVRNIWEPVSTRLDEAEKRFRKARRRNRRSLRRASRWMRDISMNVSALEEKLDDLYEVKKSRVPCTNLGAALQIDVIAEDGCGASTIYHVVANDTIMLGTIGQLSYRLKTLPDIVRRAINECKARKISDETKKKKKKQKPNPETVPIPFTSSSSSSSSSYSAAVSPSSSSDASFSFSPPFPPPSSTGAKQDNKATADDISRSKKRKVTQTTDVQPSTAATAASSADITTKTTPAVAAKPLRAIVIPVPRRVSPNGTRPQQEKEPDK
jgi:hypothetical protein